MTQPPDAHVTRRLELIARSKKDDEAQAAADAFLRTTVKSMEKEVLEVRKGFVYAAASDFIPHLDHIRRTLIILQEVADSKVFEPRLRETAVQATAWIRGTLDGKKPSELNEAALNGRN